MVGSRRTATLIGAVVVAVLAGTFLVRYVRGVEGRVASAETVVQVVVASGPLPAGVRVDAAVEAGQITLDSRRQQDVPNNAVRQLADISGLRTVLELAGGEVLTTAMFEDGSVAESSNTNDITPGYVAVSVQLDEAPSLGGLIEVGDKVNVFALVDCAAAAEDSASASAAGGPCRINASGGTPLSQRPARALFQSVKVIAVGDRFGQPSAPQPAGDVADPTATTIPSGNERLFTFELRPAEAALLLSIPSSNIYLTLNPSDYQPAPIPFVPDIQFLPGEVGTSSDSDRAAVRDGGR